jgi:RNA polymerase sigma-70 factor (ECF subfamily)
MCRHLPEMAAEDTVQRVFILAFQDIRRYDSRRASPSTWLFRLADQALAMHLRSRARRLKAEQECVAQEDRHPSLDPAEREEVRRLLEQLGPVSHRIVAARYLLGYSTEEIATEMGMRVESVQKRLRRCLARLQVTARQGKIQGTY